jgi:hypothetical protein
MIDFFPVSPFNKGNPLFTTQGNASMNAAIFRFFFTLAPDSGRLARERRNGKLTPKASNRRLFLCLNFK